MHGGTPCLLLSAAKVAVFCHTCKRFHANVALPLPTCRSSVVLEESLLEPFQLVVGLADVVHVDVEGAVGLARLVHRGMGEQPVVALLQVEEPRQ